MSVARKTRITQALTVVYVVFFSLPMLFFWYTPMWTYNYNYDRMASFLRLMTLGLSPYAFLVMGIICYRKGLKLRTYIATVLLLWAIQMQISLLVTTIILENMPIYFRHPFS